MKRVKFLVMILAMVLIVSACGKNDEGANNSSNAKGGNSDEVVELSFGTTQTEQSNIAAALHGLKEKAEAESDGKIKINLHFNSELGGEREMVEAVNIGTLDGVITSTGVISNFVDEMGVLDLPFIFEDTDHARAMMNGEVGDILSGKLEENNFKLLVWAENGFRHITNNKKPIVHPEDLKGMKIRTMEVKVHQEAFQELGASPTPMAWGEVFTSLQQGVIDGQENPIAIIYSSKLEEVQKYTSLTGHVYSPLALMLNKDVFDNLSEENQKILLSAAEEGQKANYTYMDEEEEKNKNALIESGMQFNEVDKSEFKEKIAPVIDEYKDDFKELYDLIVQ